MKSNSHTNLYVRHLELSLFKLIVCIFLIYCDKLQIVVFLSLRRVPDIWQEMVGLPWNVVAIEASEWVVLFKPLFPTFVCYALYIDSCFCIRSFLLLNILFWLEYSVLVFFNVNEYSRQLKIYQTKIKQSIIGIVCVYM